MRTFANKVFKKTLPQLMGCRAGELARLWAFMSFVFLSVSLSAVAEEEFSFDGDDLEDELEELDRKQGVDSDEVEKRKRKARKKKKEVGGGDFGSADEAEEGSVHLTRYDRVKSISRKKFLKRKRFELSTNLAVNINDAYFQHVMAGLRGTYHITDGFALELGGLANLLPYSGQATSLNVVGYQLSHILNEGRFHGVVDLGFTFSPIYGKFAVMGDNITHFDVFVSSGLGLAIDGNDGSAFRAGEVGLNPAWEIGVGARVFVNRWLAVRAELRDYIYNLKKNQFSVRQDVLVFQLGASFFFPLGFDYEIAGAEVVDE